MGMPDRDLLFAMLAAKTQFVDSATIHESLSQVEGHADHSLEQSLVDRGVIDEEVSQALKILVDQHIRVSGGDVAESLDRVLEGENADDTNATQKTIRLMRAEIKPAAADTKRNLAGKESIANGLQSEPTQVGGTKPTTQQQNLGEDSGVQFGPNALLRRKNNDPYLLQTAHRFEVEGSLARGGIGEVFRARDIELNRDVAVKKIQQRYLKDSFFRDRFLLEAEVTGSLEHPNIVPVYGFGVDRQGTPYYAMRLIKGESLTAKIAELYDKSKQNAEDVEESKTGNETYHVRLKKLLNRFVAVCHAVHYAHSRGVLHRDIKPDNIMVGEFGETLVLDWGLAKMMNARSKERINRLEGQHSLAPGADVDLTRTIDGAMVGTPSYMSPEQSLGWHDSLSAASDVYSLGATLYNLLTGHRVVEGLSLQETLIRTQRGEFRAPIDVNGRIHPALNAICLRALAPSASKRYPSALELAEEVESYLNDGIVKAWEEPLTARAGRWMRNHRSLTAGIVSSTALLVVFLLVGLVWTSAAKQRQERLAEEAIQERNRAQEFANLAHAAVESYLSEVTEDPALANNSFQSLRSRLLQTALPFYEKLAESTQDPSVQISRATAFHRLGLIHEELGEFEQAQKEYERALEVVQDSKEEKLDELAIDSRVASLINLASVTFTLGDTTKAKQVLEQAWEQAQRLEDTNQAKPDLLRRLATIRNNQAAMLSTNFEHQEAIAKYEEAARLRQDLTSQPKHTTIDEAEYVMTLANLALSYQALGQIEKTESTLDEAESYSQNFSERGQNYPELLSARAEVLDKQGSLYSSLQDYERSESSWTLAYELFKQLVEQRPEVIAYQQRLASVASNLGGHYFALDQYEKARPLVESSLRRRMAIANQIGMNSTIGKTILSTRNNLASFEMEQGNFDAAGTHLDEIKRLLDELKPFLNEDAALTYTATNSKLLLARMANLRDQTSQAISLLREAVTLAGNLVEETPGVIENEILLGLVSQELGETIGYTDDLDEAVMLIEQAIVKRNKIIDSNPELTSIRSDLAMSLITKSQMLEQQDPGYDSRDDMQAAVDELRIVVENAPSDPLAGRRLSFALYLLGLAEREIGNDLEGRKALEEATRVRPDPPLLIQLAYADSLAEGAEIKRCVDLLAQLDSEIRTESNNMLEAAAILAVAYREAAENNRFENDDQKAEMRKRIIDYLRLVDVDKGGDQHFIKAWVEQDPRFDYVAEQGLLEELF